LNDALTGLGNGNKPGGDHTPRGLDLPKVGPAIGPVGGNHQPSKTDNLVATKGHNGLGEKLSSTGTLHLPKTQGLESPRKASGGEHRTNSPVSLGGATPRNGTSLPGGAGHVGNGIGGGNGVGGTGAKLDAQHREHAFFTKPVTDSPLSLKNDAAARNLPKFEPRTQNHVGTNPGLGNHAAASHAGTNGNLPRDIALPRFDVQQPRIDSRPAHTNSLGSNNPQPRVNAPTLLPRAGGNGNAAVTRMQTVPQSFAPSSVPRSMTTVPQSFRSSPAPRMSTGGGVSSFRPSVAPSHVGGMHVGSGHVGGMSGGHVGGGHVGGGHVGGGHSGGHAGHH
jgi:hypothetical protein